MERCVLLCSPYFVMPLRKPQGGYLTLVLQHQLPLVLFTTLDEFQRLVGCAALWHLCIVLSLPSCIEQSLFPSDLKCSTGMYFLNMLPGQPGMILGFSLD